MWADCHTTLHFLPLPTFLATANDSRPRAKGWFFWLPIKILPEHRRITLFGLASCWLVFSSSSISALISAGESWLSTLRWFQRVLPTLHSTLSSVGVSSLHHHAEFGGCFYSVLHAEFGGSLPGLPHLLLPYRLISALSSVGDPLPFTVGSYSQLQYYITCKHIYCPFCVHIVWIKSAVSPS